MFLFGLKLSILCCLLVLVQTDCPAWLNIRQPGVSKTFSQRPMVAPEQAESCPLPTIWIPGPAPLASEWAWKWTCHEHLNGLSLVCLDQPQKKPALDHPSLQDWEQHLQEGFSSTKPGVNDLARIILGASLASQNENWVLVGRCLDFLSKKGWPLPVSLQNQAPKVEWLALRYEIARAQTAADQPGFANNRDYSSQFKAYSATQASGEGHVVWDHALAMARYQRAIALRRPADAMAYYREAQYFHSTLQTDYLADRQMIKAAQRSTEISLWDYHLGLGVLVLILAGTWYRKGLHSPVVEVYERLQGNDAVQSWQLSMADPEALSALRTQLVHTNEAWENFKLAFEQNCPGFIAWILNLSPGMTQGELRTACMILLGMTSREIARAQNISIYGVAQSRYRLRKRLGLPHQVTIEEAFWLRGNEVKTGGFKLELV